MGSIANALYGRAYDRNSTLYLLNLLTLTWTKLLHILQTLKYGVKHLASSSRSYTPKACVKTLPPCRTRWIFSWDEIERNLRTYVLVWVLKDEGVSSKNRSDEYLEWCVRKHGVGRGLKPLPEAPSWPDFCRRKLWGHKRTGWKPVVSLLDLVQTISPVGKTLLHHHPKLPCLDVSCNLEHSG